MFDISLFAEANTAIWLISVVIAYFIGNISPAILISKAAGFDIRGKGSGNAGTTNMLRVMGKKAAAATLVIDILKGVAAVTLGRFMGGETLAVLCGLMVFIGHIWPLVFGFRGGKGIATALGILLTLSPIAGLLSLGIAIIGFVVSRRVSVGSLLAAVCLPFIAYFYLNDYIWALLIMSVIVIIKHRSNIKRLFKGEEPKVNFKK